MRSLTTRAAGLLILAGGIWGGLVPFVGPYFHFALGPTKAWTWTSGRLWLDVLPGIAAVIGGLMLLGAGPRPSGRLGALLAICAGIWFAIGPDISLLWNSAGAQGAAHGGRGVRMLEMLTYHTGLGALMAMLGGYALPGLLRPVVAPAAAAEPRAAETRAAETGAGTVPAAGTRAGAVPAAASAGTTTAASPAAAADTRIADRPAATTAPPTTTQAPARTTQPADSTPAATTQTADGAPDATTAGTRGTAYTDTGHSTRRRRGGLRSLFARH